MEAYMGKNNLLEWLKKTSIPLTTIAKKSNVSRATLYQCINGGHIRDKSYNKIYNAFKNEIELENTNIHLEGSNSVEAQYIIDLQKEKIERLEKDLEQYRNRPIQSSQWDNLEYHMYSVVKVTYTFPNIVGRTMTVLENRNRIEHYLGYNQQDIEDLWQIGTYYKVFNDHPVNAIIAKQSLKDIDKQVSTMPTLFDSLKNMIGSHYIPVPVSFICKDKSIQHSITYNKIDWINKTIESKTQFIIDE